MGFYGQVVYEFKKLFSSLKITNTSNNEEAITPPSNEDTRVQALQPWDELNIAPSNRWIQLGGNPATKTLTIGHSTPGEKDDNKTVIGFSKVAEKNSPEDERPATFTPLKYGDYIETTSSNYDQAGHSISSTKTYFQLPFDETDTNIEKLQEDVAHIFENFLTTSTDGAAAQKGINLDEYLSSKEYVNEETLGDYVHAYLTNPEHLYVTTALTGELSTIYPDGMTEKTLAETIGDITVMYPEGDYDSIANTIGPVTSSTGYSAEMNRRLQTTDQVYSISAAIMGLLRIIDQLQSDLDDQAAANRYLLSGLEGLTARVTQLENTINPPQTSE